MTAPVVENFHDLILVDGAAAVFVVDHEFYQVEEAFGLTPARALG